VRNVLCIHFVCQCISLAVAAFCLTLYHACSLNTTVFHKCVVYIKDFACLVVVVLSVIANND
jgi:hypothetical protein